MFDWLFGGKRRDDEARPLVRGEEAPVAPIELRVAMVVHDPVLEAHGGRRLHQHFGWHDPDALARQYADDLRLASGGLAHYSVVERHVVDGYPAKVDGFRYDDAEYLRCWARRGGFHQPDAADYHAILAEFDLTARVLRGEVDEVWLFAFPYAGYYESHMAGSGAIWCNSPPLAGSEGCGRRFVVMGFNYERDVGCMLENFGHRVESIMAHVYRGHRGERNLWERFTRYDQSHPNRAECGNVHFAPSSAHDYDWGNPRPVLSRADAWYGFPDLSAPPREVRAHEWGGGDMRAHHLWWLDHLPRAPGSTDGVLNNWWQYALRPDLHL
ncbi:MAG TPA: hypothetical protein PKD53_08740 [Chloroflexaceae bacterium]|nr:hypothetical protein [Chloroflexaceae bacterium]